VITAEHERDEAGAPPGGDLLAGGVELFPRGGAVRQLAVADVGQGEILEVALGPRRVRLDGVGGQADVAGPAVRTFTEVDPPLERDAVDEDPGVGRRAVAGDEAG
jgi:hypothetical protein